MYRHEKIFRVKVTVVGILYVAILTLIMIEMYRDVMTRGRCLSIVHTTEWLSTHYGEYPTNTDLLIHQLSDCYSWSLTSRLLQPQYFGQPQMLWDADSNLGLTPSDRTLARAGDLLYWSNGQIIHLGYLNRFGVTIRVI